MELINLHDFIENTIADFNAEYFSLDRKLPEAFKNYVKSNAGGEKFTFYDYTTVVSSGLNIYCPNQWFYIAAYYCKLYPALKQYKDAVYTYATLPASQKDYQSYFNGLLNDIESAKKIFAGSGLENEKIELLATFLSNYSWWRGGKGIERNDFYYSPILSSAALVNQSQSYVAEICKYLVENPTALGILQETINSVQSSFAEVYLESIPRQVIYYGAPGTGKSNELNEKTKGFDVVRTTFHPDSDYSSFVGAYKPIAEVVEKKQIVWDFTAKSAVELPVFDQSGRPVYESKITYSFVQQAFLKAYIAAWKKYNSISFISTSPSPGVDKATGDPSSPYTASAVGTPQSTFDYTPDGATLNKDEIDLLAQVDAFVLPYSGCKSMAELHEKITLYVSSKKIVKKEKIISRDELKLYLEELEKEFEIVKEERHALQNGPDTKNENPNTIQKKLQDLEIRQGSINDTISIIKGRLDDPSSTTEITITYEYSLLGECDKKNDKVYLYIDNIRDNYTKPDYYCHRLVSTYIHEMFHYMFKDKSYGAEVEEAIVECCTLCAIEKLEESLSSSSTYWQNMSIKCKREIDKKKVNLPEYGFGSYLFESRSLDWMDIYFNAPNQVDNTDARYKEYVKLVSSIYPWTQEQHAMDLLYSLIKNVKKKEGLPASAIQYLIIEEINRGNCAQIFGDIFQLLDRNDYGFSKYPITPDDDVRRCLEAEFASVNIPSSIDRLFNEPVSDKIKKGELLVLPNNLRIYATMNTSDQSLFPMDSAFKRRWDWKYFAIKDEEKDYSIGLSDGSTYKWWETIEALNSKILATTKSADKQIGYWFVKLPEGEKSISAKTFVSKVIFYLWNDVFKDYSFSDNNAFTSEITFDKFYDGEGNVVEQTVKDFMERNYPKVEGTQE